MRSSKPSAASAGSRPGGQRHDTHVEPGAHGELHPAEGRGVARSVGVEAEIEVARQAPELLQLRLRERGSHRGHDGLEPGLVQRENVRVALDHDRAVLLGDRRSCEVKPVDERALAEELALGRVHVLRRNRVVVAETTRPEAEHAPSAVREREDEPARVVVVAAPVHEPGGDQLLLLVAFPARLLCEHHAAGREAEPEFLADVVRQARARRGRRAQARRQAIPRACARSRSPPARGAPAGAPCASAPPRPVARSPRTRAGCGSGRRAIRSRRRSRAPRSRGRTR